MGQIKTFRDLLVWRKSMEMVTHVYKLTADFPSDEKYGLTSQIRRSAVSIPSNIAEGYGRNSTGDYVRFLRIACGSAYELATQMEISLNLEYLTTSQFETVNARTLEIERMLGSMISKISNTRGGNHANKI